MIQQRVISEYRSEQERAKEPGYVSRYDDFYEYDEKQPPKLPEKMHAEPGEAEPRPPHTAPKKKPAAEDPAVEREWSPL